jgi:ATP-dependent RNA helicase HelY
VGMATEIRRLEEGLEGYREAMACHLGDFSEYAELRERLSRREKSATREAALRRRDAANDAMKELRPGDVIIIASGKRAGPALVLDSGTGRSAHDDRRPMIMTAERQVRRISASELGASVEVVAHIRIPKHFSPRNASDRKVLASQLHEAAAAHLTGGLRKKKGSSDRHGDDAVITEIRQRLRTHPCHGCSDREQHARWSERYFRARREIADLEGRVSGRTNSIAKRFDRILRVLAELGYVTDAGDDAKVTDDGNMLMRVYSEADLLVGECVRRGIWQGLDAADLAAACSCLLFESRSMDDEEAPRLPKGEFREALTRMADLWSELHGIEERHGLAVTRTLDPGFAWAVHRWANGTSLQVILMTTDLTAGDFVRWIRQIIDLLGQIAQAVDPEDPLRLIAHEAADRLNRGVVAPTNRG